MISLLFLIGVILTHPTSSTGFNRPRGTRSFLPDDRGLDDSAFYKDSHYCGGKVRKVRSSVGSGPY